jgi:DNA-directed RNA polymerase subunit F
MTKEQLEEVKENILSNKEISQDVLKNVFEILPNIETAIKARDNVNRVISTTFDNYFKEM